MRDVRDDVADLDFFQEFVCRAISRGIKIAIASFGRYDVIQAYLDRAVGPGIFTRENIATPSQYGLSDGHAIHGGKVPMLEALSYKLLGANPKTLPSLAKSVIFFDDSRDNIRGAVENGFVRSVHVDRRGFCRALWSDVSISLGLKDFLD